MTITQHCYINFDVGQKGGWVSSTMLLDGQFAPYNFYTQYLHAIPIATVD